VQNRVETLSDCSQSKETTIETDTEGQGGGPRRRAIEESYIEEKKWGEDWECQENLRKTLETEKIH
jgi:hypothetical protein